MIDMLAAYGLASLAAILFYNLGVRRERGRQTRYREIQEVKRKARKGIKLRRIRFRR